ncbi:MAG: hypothetical protein MJ224_00025 [archaeon]|nr:hypothetical protein [archaeon]
MRALGVMAPPLKEIEGNLGLDIIFDKTITEEKEEGLTKEEIEKIISYNKHDVFTTKKLFEIIRYEYDAMMLLIDHYMLPMSTLSKSKASMLETIYRNNLKEPSKKSSFKYKAPSFIKLYDEQVKNAMETFEFTEDNDFDATFEFNGEKFVIKRGGAHYALKNLFKKLNEHCILVTADFGSFYPNMAANKTNPELRYIDESLD